MKVQRLINYVNYLAVPIAVAAAIGACNGSDSVTNAKTSTSAPASSAPASTAASTQTTSPALDSTPPECVKVTESGQPAPFMDSYNVPPQLKTAPVITMEGCGEPPQQLIAADLVPGEGQTVSKGDTVTVNYVGAMWPDGKQFDSSWSRQQAATFPLDGVIQGWGEGLVGMKAGGRRLLVIPPDLAYGAQGRPPTIPANSTLVFIVDMLKVA